MSKSIRFTPRTILISVITIAILSVVMTVYSVAGGGAKGNVGADTYGVFPDGLKAFHDTLEELSLPAKRKISPPTENLPADAVCILWNPRFDLLDSEPAHLMKLRVWVEQGGRLIVAPPIQGSARLLNLLGVYGVRVQSQNFWGGDFSDDLANFDSSSYELIRDGVTSLMDRIETPQTSVSVRFEGALEYLSERVSQLRLYQVAVPGLKVTGDRCMGSIFISSEENRENENSPSRADDDVCIAAQFQVGKGEVVLFSAPWVAENILFAKEDNSVLLADLATTRNGPILFDEFYHGKAIRGNIFYLISKPTYGLLFLLFLTAASMWSWRESFFLGPALETAEPSRRSIREYIVAMSRLLRSGKQASVYLLNELKQGVLFRLKEEYALDQKVFDYKIVLDQMERKRPTDARQIRRFLELIDIAIQSGRPANKQIETIIKEFPTCL